MPSTTGFELDQANKESWERMRRKSAIWSKSEIEAEHEAALREKSYPRPEAVCCHCGEGYGGKGGGLRYGYDRDHADDDSCDVYCRDCADEKREMVQQEAEREERRAKARATILRRMPGQPAGFTLDIYAERDACAAESVRVTREWFQTTPRPNLLLWGDTGVGKTTLAALLALAVHDDGDSVAWVNVAQHLTRVKATFDDKSKVAPVVKLAAGLLVIDDLGLERTTDWTRDVVTEWIMARSDSGRPMIVTSNYQPSDLVDHLAGHQGSRRSQLSNPVVGRRLVSRIVGNGAVVLEVQGPDRRIEATAGQNDRAQGGR